MPCVCYVHYLHLMEKLVIISLWSVTVQPLGANASVWKRNFGLLAVQFFFNRMDE